MKSLFSIILLMGLSGCAGTTIVSKSLPCNPPAAFTQPTLALPQLPSRNMTEKEALQQWVYDINSYNNAKYKNDVLNYWIKKYCKK